MRKKLVYLNIIALLILCVIYIIQNQPLHTVKYFPFDPNINFDYAETSLLLSRQESPYMIVWESKSKTSEPVYLRQDISLLYKNGKLIGLRSKWEENIEEMRVKELIQGNNDQAYFQAISFHHGESHYNENDIKSIQQMSHDHLYVTKQRDLLFQGSKHTLANLTNEEKELDKQVKQMLLTRWHELINHHHIQIEDYITVPLTNLDQANKDGTLPLPEKYANQIIGQLWEGLYKNYILTTTKTNNNSFVPIILFAKDESHLLVLFKIDNEYEKLIQQYPKLTGD